METQHFYASLALMPEFPRYQEFIESSARRAPGTLGHRYAALVHQGVLAKRASMLTAMFCPDMPEPVVSFISDSWTASLLAAIEYACLQRRAEEILACVQEAYKIFREEETVMQNRRIMLDNLDTTYRRPN